jgi:hypothetical protein
VSSAFASLPGWTSIRWTSILSRAVLRPDELLDDAFRAALTHTAGVMAKLRPDN